MKPVRGFDLFQAPKREKVPGTINGGKINENNRRD
jgi:hypothetical protein